MPAFPQQKFIWPVIVAALSLLFAWLIFKGYLFHPNRYMFAFGGDPLVIYYDMMYHVCHGSGNKLTAMNYPFGEYIFLTDMQGAVTKVLSWFNKAVFNTCACIPGIVHGLNIYLLPVSSLFIFYVFRYFKVSTIVAVVFAVLITFLSPQMLRLGGHFGLGYPFLIPMSIWWVLRKHKTGKLELPDLAIFITLIFFMFNNPYSGITSTGFLICAALVYLVMSFQKKQYLKKVLIIGGVGLMSTLIPFLFFHVNDPVDDRIKEQWGFFYYYTSFEGLFIPFNSLLYGLLTSLKVKLDEMNFEGWVNLGLVGSILFIAMFITWITGLINGRSVNDERSFKDEKKIILGASVIMLIAAMNYPLYGFAKEWLENHMGPLLMFKASGRLAWSFYFVITIMGIVFLDRFIRKIKMSWMAYGVVAIAAILWTFEIRKYIAVRYADTFHPNFFDKQHEDEIKQILLQNKISTDDFQAMLVLPKMIAWSDHFLSDIHWASQFYSMRLSVATGLPMTSAMLSRLSTGHAADAIQLHGHPLIEKELIKHLPDDRDLLVLLGGDHPPLMPGERSLLENADTLYTSKEFSLFSIHLDYFTNNARIRDAQKFYVSGDHSTHPQLQLNFDETNTSVSFYGNGSKMIPRGSTALFRDTLTGVVDSQFVFSAWTYIDHQRPGLGEWRILVKDETGQTYFDQKIETRKSPDIQYMWIRSEIVFPYRAGQTLEIIVDATKELFIDELLIRPVDDTIIHDDSQSEYFLYNGYKVSKPPLLD